MPSKYSLPIMQSYSEKIEKVYKKNLIPINWNNEIQEIKKIYAITSQKPNLPLFLFETKKNVFLGITLARQSSDLELYIAHEIIQKEQKQEEWNSIRQNGKIQLIQYRLPNEDSSLKLIAISHFSVNSSDNIAINEFGLKIVELLEKIQLEFRQQLKKIAHLVLNT